MNTTTETKIVFNKLSEMIAYSLANEYNAHRRWTLEDRTVEVFDCSPQKLTAWRQLEIRETDDHPMVYRHQFEGKFEGWEVAYKKAVKDHDASQERIRKARPASHSEVQLFLYESDGSRSWGRDSKTIYLGTKLGEAILAVWPTRDSYHGRHSYQNIIRCGRLTITGIVKKLNAVQGGKLAKQIKTAKVEADLVHKKNIRNSYRNQIRMMAGKLDELTIEAINKGVDLESTDEGMLILQAIGLMLKLEDEK